MKRFSENKLIIIAVAVSLAIVSVMAFASPYSYAEFTKSHRAKRVIAAYSSEGMLFSSNYLKAGSALVYKPLYLESNLELSKNATIKICNYSQENPAHHYEGYIPYVISAEVVQLETRDGELTPVRRESHPSGIMFNGNEIHSGYATTGGILSENTPEIEYTITLPREGMVGTGYYLMVTATPEPNDLSSISALFEIAGMSQAVHLNWTIEASDDRNQSISEFSGFNYRLYGTGAGTVTLTWDSSKLKISEVFKDSVTVSAISAGAISVSVDADIINNYDIQFYPTSKGIVTAWSAVNVDCSFEEATP